MSRMDDKTTSVGRWMVERLNNDIYTFAQIDSQSSVLEIGPGRGAFAGYCLAKGVDYWAIEPNKKVALALEHQGVPVARAMVPPLPQMDKQFDVIVMNNVLEHMDTMTAALEVAKQAYAYLKPAGRFVVYSPDYVNCRYLFYMSDFSHNYIITWHRLKGLLSSAGFDVIKARYQNALFKGLLCVISSALASWLPFGRLKATFPENKLFSKLYKLQSPFLRRILMAGIKQPT